LGMPGLAATAGRADKVLPGSNREEIVRSSTLQPARRLGSEVFCGSGINEKGLEN
jgi:hypothetical protein